MKNKVMKKILMVMLSATMLIGSASVTAFAQANENAEQTEATEQVIEVSMFGLLCCSTVGTTTRNAIAAAAATITFML